MTKLSTEAIEVLKLALFRLQNDNMLPTKQRADFETAIRALIAIGGARR